MPKVEVAGKPLIATLPALPPKVIQPPLDDNVVPLFTAIPPVVAPAELAHKVMSPPLVVKLAPAVTLPVALSKMPLPVAVLVRLLLTVISLPYTVIGPFAVMPVVEIDGKAIGGGKPGPIVARLREIYLDEMRKAAL